MAEDTLLNPLELATEVTIAWLSNQSNRVTREEAQSFLRDTYATMTELSTGAVPQADVGATGAGEAFAPAVSVRRSLASKDHIISLIDGKPYKTLRRHLSTHGLTPEQYRERYNLKSDYPMVAENYSETRRNMAKKIGLGRKPGVKVATKKA